MTFVSLEKKEFRTDEIVYIDANDFSTDKRCWNCFVLLNEGKRE